MKIFEKIRNIIGSRATINPTNSISIIPDTVKVDEKNALRERVRKAFAEQEHAMRLRAFKAHSAACPDEWTCAKEPCFVVEPDKIVVHKEDCVHFNGVIPGQPFCKCP